MCYNCTISPPLAMAPPLFMTLPICLGVEIHFRNTSHMQQTSMSLVAPVAIGLDLMPPLFHTHTYMN